MKTAVLNFITTNQISLEIRHKYENIFLEMDVDKDGSLSADEIKTGLAAMVEKEHILMTQEDIDDFVKLADTDGDGSISYNEFLTAVVTQEELQSESQLKQAFSLFDEDGDDNITPYELQKVLGFVNGMDRRMA